MIKSNKNTYLQIPATYPAHLKYRKLIIFLFACFLSRVSYGQDINFTQFYVNPALLNPSFTGTEGRPAIFLSYRKQWAGLDGSPSTMNFNVQTSLPNRVNLGMNVSSQKVGLVSTTGFLFAGGYTLPLATNNFVRFGISFGGSFNKVDVASLNFGSAAGNNPNDPLLANLAGNSFQPAGNLGVSYHTKSFHAGVALPSLFQPIYLTSSAFSTNFKPFDNVVLHASNRFYLANGKDVFEPYVVYRLSKGLPGQFEVAALFHYQHVGWIGASYKQDFGISGLLGLKMNKLIALGYSYSLPSAGTNEIGRPSHEIHLAYLFGQHKKEIVQTYSFVDTDKEKLRKKTGREPVVAKKTTPAKPVPQKVEPKKEPIKTAPVAEEKPTNVLPVAPVVDAQHHEEQEKIKRLEVHAENPLEEHNETNHPHAERHEFVKRGGHHAEMDLGDYVIAGVFRAEANAKRYSEGLQKMGFSDIDYGFLTEKQLWYVHLSGSNVIDEARQMRDKFRKLHVFRDSWLLTVHN